MAQSTNRNETIDIMRGLAMICVVLGHCGFPYTQHLYLFHMGAFIFISGYCYNKKNSDNLKSLKSYFGRKMISLYLPYAIFTAIFILLFNWMIDIGILSNNPSAKTPVEYRVWWKTLNGVLSSFHFEGYAAEQLCGAAWFVIVLIEIVFFFSMLCWVLKLLIRNEHVRNAVILAVSLYFLWLGNYYRVHNLNLNDFLAASCSCLILYTGGVFSQGVYASQRNKMEAMDKLHSNSPINCWALLGRKERTYKSWKQCLPIAVLYDYLYYDRIVTSVCSQ